MPLTGEVRALLVFVRFADDDRAGDGCAEGGAQWPTDADRPVFADGLLSPTPGGVAPDSSLTALYRLASSGRFELYGSTFGYVTAHPEAHYFPDRIELERERLTREILGALRSQGVPLADYDANGDGVLDQLIVVVRSFSPARGLFDCRLVNGTARCASGIATLYDGLAIPAAEFGIRVHPVTSGQYNVYQSIRPYADLVGLLSHETGHHLWTYHGLTDVHLDPIVGNGIPADHDAAGALALMLGAGRMYAKTAFPTAAERDILSEALPPAERWLTCATPEPGRAYELGDTFSTNDCLRLDFGPACAGCTRSRLMVSGVYRETPFTQASRPFTTVSSQCPGCVQVEAGLPATGVMLEVVRPTSDGTSLRDLLPADGRLDTFAGCGILAAVAPSAADVFGADFWTAGARAIHPFSSPNIYGYASLLETPRSVYDTGGPPHELSGFRADASGRVAFDYRTDLLARDSLVADGDWSFGPQFGPLSFSAFRMGAPGRFILVDDTRLTVGRLDLRLARHIILGDDIQLVATRTLFPPPDTRVVVEVGARSELVIPQGRASGAVRVDEDAFLHVQGDLTIHGALELAPGARLWVDGDLDLRAPTAESDELLLRGSVRVLGRLITSAPAGRLIRVDGDLEVGGVWQVADGPVVVEAGRPQLTPPRLTLRGGVSLLDAGRLSLTLSDAAHADVGGLLPIRAGSGIVMNDATLASEGGIHVESGASMSVAGGAVRFGPGARLDVSGQFQADFGTSAEPAHLTALDAEAGWGGLFLRSGMGQTMLLRSLNVSGVVGQPALVSEASSLSMASVRIDSPQAGGAVVIRGGRALLTRVEIGPAAGVGLDVSGGADVTLTPPVSVVGHRVALRVDSSVVQSSCAAASACPGEPTSVLPDRSLSDATEVELWNAGTLRLPYARWWVPLPDLLFVGGDGTGTLDVTPMGPAQPGAPVPPVLQEVGTVTPNPARASMSVPVSLSTGTTVRLDVHDVLGRRVATQTLRLERGHHRVPLPIGFVPAGTYLLTVEFTLPLREPTRHVQPFTVVR